jgi:transcription elongation GreA/GreB family factor
MTLPSSHRYLLSRGGLERLQQRIAEARRSYKAVCDDNPAAAESGDSSVWHDNFAFEENQRQMHQLARRIRDLEAIFRGATLISAEEAPRDRAFVGSRVLYRLDEDGPARSCILVGWDDGEPRNQRISYNSPLGAALFGAHPGEQREVLLAGKSHTVEILQVELAEDELS